MHDEGRFKSAFKAGHRTTCVYFCSLITDNGHVRAFRHVTQKRILQNASVNYEGEKFRISHQNSEVLKPELGCNLN